MALFQQLARPMNFLNGGGTQNSHEFLKGNRKIRAEHA
jgi:hypothetical protein